MPAYDAVLFDSDGILVEPPAPETQAAATRAAFRAVGVDEAESHHIEAIVSGVTVGSLEAMCRTYGIDPETFWSAREGLDEQSQIAAFEAGQRGLYDDVDAIRDLPVATGIVSNNHHTTVEYVVDQFDLSFDTSHGREMTIESLERKKPNTYYVDEALVELGTESALYVGDSEDDVEAARRAGIDSAFVRRPHCQDVDLSVVPTYDVTDLHEVARIVTE